ncbi:hypothetical protein AB0I28_27280 [Phytomonospora sp. NPDC050363]|uniref:WXG100-like domain-containing protein n=1 Tax=Phytomonospora sp. NPDC050363 TaxID=3155642 RepID=UPI0033C5400C
MGMQLPGMLITLLDELGYTWPEGDETKLFELGRLWMGLSSTLKSGTAALDGPAQGVWAQNQGDAVEAFKAKWTDQNFASVNLADAGDDVVLVGIGVFISAAIVLALKITVIVQLIILAIQIAQAIATAGPSFGATLAEIPIFKAITGVIIDQIINMAIEELLG